jgi:hypothetical protein
VLNAVIGEVEVAVAHVADGVSHQCGSPLIREHPQLLPVTLEQQGMRQLKGALGAWVLAESPLELLLLLRIPELYWQRLSR